jgi:hypothetical protein
LQWLAALAASGSGTEGGAALSQSAATILNVALGTLNLGLAGLVIYWFFSGKLHSDDEMSAERERRETAEAALERTREALALANARSDTGALSAELIAQAFGSRRDRRDEDNDRRRERRYEDDDRRMRRRQQDDGRRDDRAAEDDGIRGYDDRWNREGPYVPSQED